MKRKIIQNFPSKKNKFWQHWEIVTIIYVKIDESEICYRSLVPTIRFLGEKNNCEFFFSWNRTLWSFFHAPSRFFFCKSKNSGNLSPPRRRRIKTLEKWCIKCLLAADDIKGRVRVRLCMSFWYIYYYIYIAICIF